MHSASEQLKPVTLGCSGDAVWQVWQRQDGQETCSAYLKQSKRLKELHQEHDSLLWLKDKVKVPEVLKYSENKQIGLLRTSALNGQPASDSVSDRSQLIQTLAKQLKKLHSLNIKDCPLDAQLKLKLAQAKAHMLNGWVDEDDFEPEYLGTPIQVLYQQLLDQKPQTEDLVFCHGDACLPNFIVKETSGKIHFVGWVDLGRAGIADRWQDLALFCRSLKHNGYAQIEVEEALNAYGIAFNAEKYAYYTLLDEFF